jgi:HD-GYP domain-containing protein (c-di-GMP phosphodiesterase class II)
MATSTGRPRLIELLGSLSLATDLATGQPMGHAIRTCLLSARIAEELGCGEEKVRHVRHVALLRFLGCTADASESARDVGGDDISFNRAMADVLNGSMSQAAMTMVKSIGVGLPPIQRAVLVAHGLMDTRSTEVGLASHCEVATMLAVRLRLEVPVVEALGHAYERWDGGGFPDKLEGEEVPLEIRICAVARDLDLAAQARENPTELLEARKGKAYDPAVVDAVFALPETRVPEARWEALLETEPDPVQRLDDLDETLEVMADFADLKSPWTRGHSREVALLAESAGKLAGFEDSQTENLRQAALVHDLGRVGVENGIWDKAGELSLDEWEKVRLHTYLTHRVLSRCEALGSLATIAARHHERVDGSGYHSQIDKRTLSQTDLILAAADVYVALTSDRPHRSAYTLDEAEEILLTEVDEQHLDRKAATHVLAAARGESHPPIEEYPSGLTDREVQVLRLIARERTNRQMAEELYISPKTVGRHVENIYAKIGVSTRAGAAVFAMENSLIGG